jgi:hypothetical protein
MTRPFYTYTFCLTFTFICFRTMPTLILVMIVLLTLRLLWRARCQRTAMG